jgi:hypothetical protein
LLKRRKLKFFHFHHFSIASLPKTRYEVLLLSFPSSFLIPLEGLTLRIWNVNVSHVDDVLGVEIAKSSFVIGLGSL